MNLNYNLLTCFMETTDRSEFAGIWQDNALFMVQFYDCLLEIPPDFDTVPRKTIVKVFAQVCNLGSIAQIKANSQAALH